MASGPALKPDLDCPLALNCIRSMQTLTTLSALNPTDRSWTGKHS